MGFTRESRVPEDLSAPPHSASRSVSKETPAHRASAAGAPPSKLSPSGRGTIALPTVPDTTELPGKTAALKEKREEAMEAITSRASTLSLPIPESPYHIWELLFHRSKEKLVQMRRHQEREVAKEMNLTAYQVEQFRSDLVELYGLFKQFDEDNSGSLQEEEVLKCLTCCGLQGNALNGKTLIELMIKAKQKTEEEREAMERGEDPGDDDNEKFAGARSSFLRYENMTEDDEEIQQGLNFAEFLTLMMMVRKINREANHAELREAFNKYDADHSGLLQVKELLGLFASLGLIPKTREEQQDIRMLLDEVDENGDGEFSFQEFAFLVHRVQERLDRQTRKEEEAYAAELGIPLTRCRELQDVFRFAQKSTSILKVNTNCLSITELRTCMEDLHLRYSSEELLSLYKTFGREETSQDKGGVDGRSFLRMMHAIEIAKTHGQCGVPNSAPKMAKLLKNHTTAIGALSHGFGAKLNVIAPGGNKIGSARASISVNSQRPSIVGGLVSVGGIASARPSIVGIPSSGRPSSRQEAEERPTRVVFDEGFSVG